MSTATCGLSSFFMRTTTSMTKLRSRYHVTLDREVALLFPRLFIHSSHLYPCALGYAIRRKYGHLD